MTFSDFVFKPAEVSRELIASKITRLLTRRVVENVAHLMKKKGGLGWKVFACVREAPAVLLPA